MTRHLAILASGSALALTAGAAAAQDLTISLWGGSYAEEFRRAVVEPFEQAHGVSIALETGRSGERLARLMATRARGTDLVYFTDYQMAELANRGLLQPVGAGTLDNQDDLLDFARDPFGGDLCPAFTVAAVGLAYNSELTQAPTSWNDLFDSEAPAAIGFPDINISYGPLLLLMIAQMDGAEPGDIDAGFARIRAARDDLQLFSGREVLDAINQGDVALAPHLNLFVQPDDSVPLRFAYPQEGGLGVLNLACITTGSANPELAAQFIDFHLSREVQQAMLQAQGEASVRLDVEVPATAGASAISADEMSRLHFFDVHNILENRAEWIDRWQEEVIAR